jgi:sterol desaturase/sphingolipid hydroxylase (fatty acid hydroxylase superfamily)
MVYAFILSAFFFLAVIEVLRPARRGKSDPNRVLLNTGVGVANFAMSSAMPVSAYLAAEAAQRGGWGLFNTYDMPLPFIILITVLVLTLVSYWLHRMFHELEFLWRVHQLHHSDDALDISTTFRAHPLEGLAGILVGFPVVSALGPPPWIIIAVQTTAFVAGMFHHANVRLPEGFSRKLERVLVTPAMHMIHHVPDRVFHDSNYGGLLTIWDKVFGTYRPGFSSAPPLPGLDDGITTGAKGFARRLLLQLENRST